MAQYVTHTFETRFIDDVSVEPDDAHDSAHCDGLDCLPALLATAHGGRDSHPAGAHAIKVDALAFDDEPHRQRVLADEGGDRRWGPTWIRRRQGQGHDTHRNPAGRG